MQTCEAPDCDVEFEPSRSTARYHSTTCRQRAGRARKAAAQNEAEEAKTDTPAEHELVKAVRLDLERADALGTVSGQLALQLARRIANPNEPGISTLSKELRSLLAEAKAAAAPIPHPEAGEPTDGSMGDDDEVTRARRQREEARQAAGLA